MKTIILFLLICVSRNCFAEKNNYWKDCIIRIEPIIISQGNSYVNKPWSKYYLDSNKCMNLRIELRKASWAFKYRLSEPLTDSIIYGKSFREICKLCNTMIHNDFWPRIKSLSISLSDTSIAGILSNQKVLFKINHKESDCIRELNIRCNKNGKTNIQINSEEYRVIIPIYFSKDTITILENDIIYPKRRKTKQINYWEYYIWPKINPFYMLTCESKY